MSDNDRGSQPEIVLMWEGKPITSEWPGKDALLFYFQTVPLSAGEIATICRQAGIEPINEPAA